MLTQKSVNKHNKKFKIFSNIIFDFQKEILKKIKQKISKKQFKKKTFIKKFKFEKV